jgi:MraZ protein
MMSRKTQYGWMAVGAMLCLLGIGTALKIRDNNKAVAQNDPPVTHFPGSIPEVETLLPPTLDGVEAAVVPSSPPPTVIVPPLPPPTAIDLKTDPTTPVVKAPPPDAATPLPAPPTPPLVQPAPPPMPQLTPPSIPEGPIVPTPAPPPVAPVAAGTVPPPPAPQPAVSPAPPPELPPATWTKPQPLDPVPAPPSPSAIIPVSASTKTDALPGEPPLAAVAGPLQVYEVRAEETVQEIARRTLGNGERWTEIQKLNPTLKTTNPIARGTLVRLPADAAVSPIDEIDAVKPLPGMKPKSVPATPKKALPLTGTFPCTIDDKHVLTLPRALRDQLGNCDTILVTPGPDQCLWITNPCHLERMAERLEQSPAKEMDVRVFKRLYYAQTEKAVLGSDGKLSISDKLATFAGLRQDVVLVGIDEHFELWDAAKWRTYTQQKSAEARSAMTEPE